jgi:hypothetical protein
MVVGAEFAWPERLAERLIISSHGWWPTAGVASCIIAAYQYIKPLIPLTSREVLAMPAVLKGKVILVNGGGPWLGHD